MIAAREIPTGELSCLDCSRVAATARQWPDGVRVTPVFPEYTEAVRQKRCPACGGRLWIVDTRVEVVRQWHLTPADMAPKRGRPARTRDADGSPVERLVKLLNSGGPMHVEYLTDRLGISQASLRNAVSMARQCGYQIRTTYCGYQLENES